jgi:hypothetical protein
LPHIDYIEVVGILPLEAPEVPTGLTATAAISTGQIDLTWDAPLGATSYNVKRSETDGGPYTPIATVEQTSYSDTDLPELTTYYYVISGVNSAGEGVDSVQAEATTSDLAPAAPTSLVAIAGGGSISLDWADNGEGDISSYNVYRSTVSGNYGTALATGVGSSTYVDTTAINNVTYYYAVTAVDTIANESGYSDAATAVLTDGSNVLLSGTDFESGFGDWVNITGEDSHDWTLDSGGTLTPNTGPDSGALASTWYMYLETSPSGAGSAGDTAILESPVIRGYRRALSFYYHMYGSQIGTLNVDVYDGSWHEGVWSLSGLQHTSSSDEYTEAIVNLGSYRGPIRIRFRGVAAGGPAGDMAIDDIRVTGGLLYGDMNADLIIDAGDLDQFMGYWLQNDCTLDLDGDCVITLSEFSEFARNWLDDSY